MVEGHYQLCGMIGQKVLRGVQVMGVLVGERGTSLALIKSAS